MVIMNLVFVFNIILIKTFNYGIIMDYCYWVFITIGT